MGQEGALIDDTEAGKFTTFPEVPIAAFWSVVMISTCLEFGGYKIADMSSFISQRRNWTLYPGDDNDTGALRHI